MDSWAGWRQCRPGVCALGFGIKYLSTTDEESLAAFELCSRLEGIIPALEPAHALHITGKLAADRKDQIIIMNMCGRGDKDLSSVLPLINEKKLKNEQNKK